MATKSASVVGSVVGHVVGCVGSGVGVGGGVDPSSMMMASCTMRPPPLRRFLLEPPPFPKHLFYNFCTPPNKQKSLSKKSPHQKKMNSKKQRSKNPSPKKSLSKISYHPPTPQNPPITIRTEGTGTCCGGCCGGCLKGGKLGLLGPRCCCCRCCCCSCSCRGAALNGSSLKVGVELGGM